MTIGNHEKAWNDPPMLAYQAGSGGQPSSDSPGLNAPTNKRTILNKRVAFPLLGNSSSNPTSCPTVSAASPSLPTLPTMGPPTSFPPINPPPIQAATGNNETKGGGVQTVEETADDQHFVKATMNSTLETLKDLDKQDEFRKRFQVLYTVWEEGKLNTDIQLRLKKLCQHIEAKEFAAADNIQVALAVDYTSECSPWILAVKNILVLLNQQ